MRGCYPLTLKRSNTASVFLTGGCQRDFPPSHPLRAFLGPLPPSYARSCFAASVRRGGRGRQEAQGDTKGDSRTRRQGTGRGREKKRKKKKNKTTKDTQRLRKVAIHPPLRLPLSAKVARTAPSAGHICARVTLTAVYGPDPAREHDPDAPAHAPSEPAGSPAAPGRSAPRPPSRGPLLHPAQR